MAQGKICSKLNELQDVLLNDKDFLKRAVESFCQKLKDVEITQFLKAGSLFIFILILKPKV